MLQLQYGTTSTNQSLMKVWIHIIIYIDYAHDAVNIICSSNVYVDYSACIHHKSGHKTECGLCRVGQNYIDPDLLGREGGGSEVEALTSLQ